MSQRPWPRKLSSFPCIAFIFVTLTFSCKQHIATQLLDNSDPIPQLLSATDLNTYQRALPKFAYGKLNDILRSKDTLWYDKKVMIPTYQDSVGHGQNAPIGIRKNSEGARLIIPEGRPLFTNDGQAWSFPFTKTAGTDRSTNLKVANFMHLPNEQGKRLPVVYWVIDQPRSRGGLGLLQWQWMFPKGTVFGELLYVTSPQGELYLTELRTRERHLTGWATNIFRPFANARQLASAIEKRRPQYANLPQLQRVIQALRGSEPLTPFQSPSTAFKGTFSQSGFVHELPDFGDEPLVKELLRESTFVSVYEEPWKRVGNQRTFAATTKSEFSVVPNHNFTGILEVNEQSCSRCHTDAQRPVMDFVPNAILYGDIWGSDQIFSFHLFNQDRYNLDGNENRSLRPAFIESGMVQAYDQSIHQDHNYRVLAGGSGQ